MHVDKYGLLSRRIVVIRVQKRVHRLTRHPHYLPDVVMEEDVHGEPGQQGADFEEGWWEGWPAENAEEVGWVEEGGHWWDGWRVVPGIGDRDRKASRELLCCGIEHGWNRFEVWFAARS